MIAAVRSLPRKETLKRASLTAPPAHQFQIFDSQFSILNRIAPISKIISHQ
jgi:hypothetical protein